MAKPKFSKGDWIQSAKVKHQPAFVGEVIDVLDGGGYVIRDAERRRWLRQEGELSPAKTKADNDNEKADQRARFNHWRL
jgi:hypothetical protein